MADNHKTIFYSWQSDTPSRLNRNFIEKALKEALKRLHSDAELEPALRDSELKLDKDTSGVPGSPPIAQTILNKIENCTAFVADLTFVGESLPDLVEESASKRLLSNPNVLVEYGYALRCHTHAAMIGVINTALGDRHMDNLPFDLRHLRWPITYCLRDENDPSRSKVLEKLATDLAGALKLILSDPPRGRADKGVEPFISAQPNGKDPSVYFDSAEDLIADAQIHREIGQIKIPKDGRAFLRLYPSAKMPPIQNALRARDLVSNGMLRPMGDQLSGWSSSRNSYGAIVYEGRSDDKIYHFTQLFLSGEIWGVDAQMLNAEVGKHWTDGKTNGYIPCTLIENVFARTLFNYEKFTRDTLNIPFPWVLEAGIVGVKGYPISVSHGFSGKILKNSVLWKITIHSLAERVDVLLKPFFEQIWEECGLARPESVANELSRFVDGLS